MWHTLREELLKISTEADHKYVNKKLHSHQLVQEQLDRSIEKEWKLLVDISELTKYSIKLKSDNRKHRQERQQDNKTSTTWHKHTKKTID